MATRNVSSMIDFINALINAESDDIIEVLADLDWNDVVDDINTTVTIGSTSTTNLTVNGNNHTIYNIDRTYFTSGSAVFSLRSGSSGFKINNLSYLNCHLSGNSNFRLWNLGNNNAEFIGGVIQGRFYGSPFAGVCTIRNFMMTFDFSKGNLMYTGTSLTVLYQNCWVRFNNCIYTPSSSAHIADNCKQCYFEGSIIYSGSASGVLFSNMDSSCINVRADLGSNPSISSIASARSGSETLLTIINSDKIVTMSPQTAKNLITVTDEQMKNAEFLVLAGFDIIP